jgi:hypothetical protein
VLYHLYSRAHRPAFQTDRSGAVTTTKLVAAQKAESAQAVRHMLRLPDPRAARNSTGSDTRAGVLSDPMGVGEAAGVDRLRQLNLQRYGLGECGTGLAKTAMLLCALLLCVCVSAWVWLINTMRLLL